MRDGPKEIIEPESCGPKNIAMSESVPNRPFRQHDSDREEPKKRTEMSEDLIYSSQIDDSFQTYVFLLCQDSAQLRE